MPSVDGRQPADSIGYRNKPDYHPAESIRDEMNHEARAGIRKGKSAKVETRKQRQKKFSGTGEQLPAAHPESNHEQHRQQRVERLHEIVERCGEISRDFFEVESRVGEHGRKW